MKKETLPLTLALLLLAPVASAGVERVGGELILSGSAARFPSTPAAAFARDGSFLVVWVEQDAGGSGFVSLGRRFDGRGNPLGDSFRIGEPVPGADVDRPQVASLAGGGFAVAWVLGQVEGQTARLRLLGADGGPQGGEIVLGPRVPGESLFLDSGRSWITATRDGELVMVWDSEWMFDLIEGQRFSAQGRALGERFVVNTGSGRVAHASVVATASGGFVIAWGQHDPLVVREAGVMARPFGAGKQPLSLEIPVIRDDVRVSHRTPAVAARPDGSFAVIARRARATRDLGLTMRVFAETGAPLGKDLRIDGGGRQVFGGPVVASGPDGHLVIAWDQLDRGSRSGLDVVARVVEADDSFAGPPFVVNTRLEGSQHDAAVATGPDGQALVVWVDNPEQGDWTVRGQLFELIR